MKYFILFIKKTLRFLLKPLSFIPALVMMYLIFGFSGQDGAESSSLSYQVAKMLVLAYNKIMDKGFDNATLEAVITVIHPYVRKCAHVTEYFFLAMAVSLPMYVYRIRGFGLTVLATLFCVAFALLDEYHQTFVPGRVGDIRDVRIDSIGIVAGVIVVRIVGFIGRKTIFSFLSLDKKERK